MCGFYDALWQPALAVLLFSSIMVVLARLKYSARGRRDRSVKAPHWLTALLFWGSGVVGFTLLMLMGGGFLCVGSPADLQGIVPN